MDRLDFMEKTAAATLVVAAASYDAAYERTNKLATLVVGGGATALLYSLGQCDKRGDVLQVLPPFILGLWLVGIAGILVLAGARSRDVNLGASAGELREIYDRFCNSDQNSDSQVDAFQRTRWRHLELIDDQIRLYSEGLTERSEALDRAYRGLVASPIPIFLGIFLSVATAR